MGKTELHTRESLTERIILHLLLLAVSDASEPRAGWEEEIVAFRVGLERKLTPTIRSKITRSLDRHYRARRLLQARLRHDEPDREAVCSTTCPCSFDQILGADDSLSESGALGT